MNGVADTGKYQMWIWGRYWNSLRMLSYPWREGLEIEAERIKGKEKVKCPYCGHNVNAFKSKDARCKGIFFKCKNKECSKEFELRI